MKLSKVMRERIDNLTVATRHLAEYEQAINEHPVEWWWDIPVGEWSREQSALFDLVHRIETDLKAEIFKELTGNRYGI